MVKCSNCGFEAENANFCPNCGTEIIMLKSPNSCPNCGEDVGSGKFCPNCGTKIENGSSKTFCPSCGKEIEKGNFCPYCGFSKTADASSGEKDTLDGIIEFDEKISGKLGGLFSKSKSMDKILDKTASFRYNNMSKAANNGMDRKYFEKIEPVFLEVYDSVDDDFVKDILLFERSMMMSGGGIIGIAASQIYTPTKDMSHDEAIRFYHGMVNKITQDITHEKQNGTFDEEEFYKKKIKESTFDSVSFLGFSKSFKKYRQNR